MKSFYVKTLVAAFAFSSITSAATADVGNGSGNGDGDQAFALQKLASLNPGLSPSQVLLKAFKESAGRIPTIVYTGASKTGTIEESYGNLFAYKPTNEFIGENHDTGVEIVFRGGKELPPESVEGALTFKKTLPKLGPLLQSPGGIESFYVVGKLKEGYNPGIALNGHKSTNGRSLVLSPDFSQSSTFLASNTAWVEMRSYTPNIVVYVVHPINSGGKFEACLPMSNPNEAYETPRATDICAVGYFWKN